jgi:DNA polymerase elongation subunit (family B)
MKIEKKKNFLLKIERKRKKKERNKRREIKVWGILKNENKKIPKIKEREEKKNIFERLI